MQHIAQLDSGFLTTLEDSIQLNFAGGNLGDIVSELLKYLFPLAGMVVLLFLLMGGYKLMFSGGDPKKVESGKDTISAALIGFIIIFVAYWIVQALGLILGLTDLTNTF